MAIPRRNCIKPLGMACRTPAEAAGMHIRGANKWLALIRNAVSAARGAANARHDALMRISVQHRHAPAGLAKNRTKARLGGQRVPGLGRIAVRIWVV